jgi:hypothetical protein
MISRTAFALAVIIPFITTSASAQIASTNYGDGTAVCNA